MKDAPGQMRSWRWKRIPSRNAINTPALDVNAAGEVRLHAEKIVAVT
jgi:hypothetical protein